MKKIITFCVLIFSMGLTAQVGINNPTPDASAALDITSKEGGILIPRMTETERNEITAAADGLLIYQTDATAGFYYYNGTAWTALAGAGTGTEGQVLTMVGGVATWIDPCVSSLFYADTDSDGYGDNSVFTVACSEPEGYASNADDCDDSDANIGTANVFYLDADNDGYGNSDSSTTSCGNILPMYVSNADDCNDADAAINPDTVWYADADSDGYGDNSTSITACEQPVGYVIIGNDCDDSDASTNPGAEEVNDGYDNDCDGDVDETATSPTLLSGYANANTFPVPHSPNYSTVNIGSDAQPQILDANTQMTKLVIHPTTTTTGVTVIPFLVDADYNVIVVGETYTINTTADAAYEIIFDSTLTASVPFYFGCYETILTKHDGNYGNENYLWESGTPELNTTISGTGTNSVRSTQGYGF